MINDEQPDDALSQLSDAHFESNELLEGGLRAAFGQNSISELGSKTTIGPGNQVPAESGPGELNVETRSEEIPQQDPSGTFRYKILGEMGRGGMGAVLKARDENLGRDLVVKVLLEKHQNSADARRRFVNEGRICSQLQHPNIVPVYEIGQLGDRPFFSMKLINGETLAQLLQSRKTPNADRQKLLDVFEKVCEAMAYAHSRGVIHRDLKPSNIMVGSFGEVQVMDWGLAKIFSIDGSNDDLDFELAESEGSAESIRKQDVTDTKNSQETRAQTAAGDILGTPAFMAPEQLRGDTRSIDQRTDVFLLGATLYVILTGQIPFQRHDKEEAARKEQLNNALSRLKSCDGHADLKKLAADCLAHEPSLRPRDAGEVAARMFEHRENVERVLRQSRRRQTWILTIAASMIAATLIASGAWLWISRLRDAQIAGFDGLLHDADTLLNAAEQDAGKRATTSLDQARVLLEQAGHQTPELHSREFESRLQTVVQRMDLAEKFRQLIGTLESIRFDFGDMLDEKLANQMYADAFNQFGIDVDSANMEEIVPILAANPAHADIASSLFEWARIRRKQVAGRDDPSWRKLVDLANATDPEPWRSQIRTSLGVEDAESMKSFVALANDDETIAKESARNLVMLARRILLGGDGATAQSLLIRTWKRFPNDFWTNFDLGSQDFKIPNTGKDQLAERVRYLTCAIALRPTSSALYTNLGSAFEDQKRVREAIDAYEESIRLNSENAKAHYNLGILFRILGQTDNSVSHLETAIRIHPDYFEAHSALGNTLLQKKETNAALLAFQRSVEINPRFVIGHFNLGNTLQLLQRTDEAIEEYRRAIEINPNFAPAYLNLARELHNQGKHEEALAALSEAIRSQPALAAAHHNRGNVLFNGLKRPDEAAESFREAIRLDPNYAESHAGLGLIHFGKGELDSAIDCFKRAIALNLRMGSIHAYLAYAYEKQGKIDKSLEELRIALKLEPTGSPLIPQLQRAIEELKKQTGTKPE